MKTPLDVVLFNIDQALEPASFRTKDWLEGLLASFRVGCCGVGEDSRHEVTSSERRSCPVAPVASCSGWTERQHYLTDKDMRILCVTCWLGTVEHKWVCPSARRWPILRAN